MPRLAAFRPGALAVVVELNAMPVYQLVFGAASWDSTPCFALQLAYAPSPMALMQPDGGIRSLAEYARVSFFRLPVNFANGTQELEKICKAANESDSLEAALTRVPEAFNLFNNNPRVKKTDVEQTGKDACDIVKAAWEVRQWTLDGYKDSKRWDVHGSVLVGHP